MNADGLVYHFTDTVRLPWILKSGALRAAGNKVGGFPEPSFLWATTDPAGDRSASGGAKGYREGYVRLVRIALRADDFEPWREIIKRLPSWTPDQVVRLERKAPSSNPQHWRCRIEPLAGSQWIAIHTRSYQDKMWRPLEDRTLAMMPDTEGCGLVIAGRVYFSKQGVGPSGATTYAVMPPGDLQDFAVLETMTRE